MGEWISGGSTLLFADVTWGVRPPGQLVRATHVRSQIRGLGPSCHQRPIRQTEGDPTRTTAGRRDNEHGEPGNDENPLQARGFVEWS